MMKLWKNMGFRAIIGWLFACVLPAIIMWPQRVLNWDFLQTQTNSFLLSSLGLLLVIFILNKLTHFPGQRSLIYVMPTFFVVTILLGIFLFITRKVYAIYYLTFSSLLGIIFLLVSQLVQQHVFKIKMAFIPLGRCENFEQMINIDWIKLNSPVIQESDLSNVQAIVADLSSAKLDQKWQKFLAEQSLQGMPVYNNLQVYESLTGRSPIQHLYENNLGSLLPSAGYLFLKRVMDLVIVIFTLPIVLFIILITTIAIRLESKGSPFFTQVRVGRGGHLFKMYKLRSMTLDAEHAGAKMAVSNDVRITKVGRFIRKMRIDELPQFLNILKGEMSFIGPRPEQPGFVEQFNESIPFYRYRHIVKPGLSGWAQVMQGYASDEDETKLKLEHDFYYIKNFSLTLDLLIVIKTVQTMLTGFGAK